MRKQDIFPLLVIILTVVVFFNKLLFKDEIFITGDFLRSDTLNQNLPFKLNYFQAFKNGNLPLWTDKIFAGYPIMAEGQSGVFYPVNFILLRVFDFVHAYNLGLVANFLIAAIGAYFFARSLGFKYLTSVFVSVVFSFSSPLVLHITHQNIVSAAVWLPWIFLFNQKFFESKNLRFLFLSIFFLAASLLAGSPQITFYIAVALCIYLTIFRKTFKYNFIRVLFSLALEFLLVLLLCSILLFPQLELIGNSTRSSGLGNIALESLPYHPRNLLTLVAPYIFGDPGLGTYPHFGGNWGMFWENTLYLGLVPFFFAVGSLFIGKRFPDIKKWWLFSIIILLLSLGKYSPTFLVYYLPVFNYFRVSSRFLFIEGFVIAVLAGFTLENFRTYKNIPASRWIVVGLLVISLLDLFKFGYLYNPTENIERVMSEPEIVNYLKKNLDEKGRIFTIGGDITYDAVNKEGWRNNNSLVLNHSNSQDADLNMLWDVSSLDGYAGLYTSDFQVYKSFVYSGLSIKNGKVEINDSSLKLLGVGSVKYLISSFELVNPNLQFVDSFGKEVDYKLYLNKFYLPKGAIFSSTTNNYEDFLKKDISKNLYITGLVNSPSFKKPSLEQDSNDKVVLKEHSENRLIYELSLSSQKWFYLSDSFYPGWKAYVDDVETPIIKANVMFRAITIPQGKHVITFKYEPEAYFYGLVISALTLSVLGFGWLTYEFRRKIV